MPQPAADLRDLQTIPFRRFLKWLEVQRFDAPDPAGWQLRLYFGLAPGQPISAENIAAALEKGTDRQSLLRQQRTQGLPLWLEAANPAETRTLLINSCFPLMALSGEAQGSFCIQGKEKLIQPFLRPLPGLYLNHTSKGWSLGLVYEKPDRGLWERSLSDPPAHPTALPGTLSQEAADWLQSLQNEPLLRQRLFRQASQLQEMAALAPALKGLPVSSPEQAWALFVEALKGLRQLSLDADAQQSLQQAFGQRAFVNQCVYTAAEQLSWTLQVRLQQALQRQADKAPSDWLDGVTLELRDTLSTRKAYQQMNWHPRDSANPLADTSALRRIQHMQNSRYYESSRKHRLFDPNSTDFLCAMETPDGLRTGLQSTLASHARPVCIDTHQRWYTLLEAPYQLESDSGAETYLHSADLAGTAHVAAAVTRAFAEMTADQGWLLPGGKFITETPPSGTTVYRQRYSSQLFGLALNQVPFRRHNDLTRLQMAANQMKQAVQITGAEVPLIGPQQQTYTWDETRAQIALPTPDADTSIPDLSPPGVNLMTGFMIWKGWNFEDAIVLSESAAAKLGYREERSFVLDLHAHLPQVLTGRLQPLLRDIRQAAQLDPDSGCVSEGAKVQAGDILVGLLERSHSLRSPQDFQQMMLSQDPVLRQLSTDHEQLYRLTDKSLRVPYGLQGTVTHLERLPAGSPGLPADIRERIVVTLTLDYPLGVGDKLSGRYGNKGVVSLILPDQDMPQYQESNGAWQPLEILLNPLGIPGRMNPGQLIEVECNSIRKGRQPYQQLRLPADQTQTTQPVTVGEMFVLRLAHHARKKVRGRAGGAHQLYSGQSRQPVGGTPRQGGVRLGQMETWALQAYAPHGKNPVLQEALHDRSERERAQVMANQLLKRGELEPAARPQRKVRQQLEQWLAALGLQLQPSEASPTLRLSRLKPSANAPKIERAHAMARGGLFDADLHHTLTLPAASCWPESDSPTVRALRLPDLGQPICWNRQALRHAPNEDPQSNPAIWLQPGSDLPLRKPWPVRARTKDTLTVSPPARSWQKLIKLIEKINTGPANPAQQLEQLAALEQQIAACQADEAEDFIVQADRHSDQGLSWLPLQTPVFDPLQYLSLARELLKDMDTVDTEPADEEPETEAEPLPQDQLSDYSAAPEPDELADGADPAADESQDQGHDDESQAPNTHGLRQLARWLRQVAQAQKPIALKDPQADCLPKVLRSLLDTLPTEDQATWPESLAGPQQLAAWLQQLRPELPLADFQLQAIPVLPAGLRPPLSLPDQQMLLPGVNHHYRQIMRFDRSCEVSRLQKAVHQLYLAASGGKEAPGLLAHLIGKTGLVQQQWLGRRVDYCGYAVITPNPELELSACSLPLKMALDMLLMHLYHPLLNPSAEGPLTTLAALFKERLGYDLSSWTCHSDRPSYPDCEAEALVDRFLQGLAHDSEGCTQILAALNDFLEKQVVLLNRYPTLHRPSIQAFTPRVHAGDTLQIHPLVCGAFNADFDGDCMAVHLTLSPEARKFADQYMRLSQQPFSPANGECLLLPGKEMIWGAYVADQQEDKKKLHQQLHDVSDAEAACQLACAIMQTGFDTATRQGLSLSLRDAHALAGDPGAAWDERLQACRKQNPHNALIQLHDSQAARTNGRQLEQWLTQRGKVLSDNLDDHRPLGEVAGCYLRGLSQADSFLSFRGARRGIFANALGTPQAGGLTNLLITLGQHVFLSESNCAASTPGILHCEALADAVCPRCYTASLPPERQNLTRGLALQPGAPIGIVAAQSLGERSTQLTMRIFHTGGVALQAEQAATADPSHADVLQQIAAVKKILRQTLNRSTEPAQAACEWSRCYGADAPALQHHIAVLLRPIQNYLKPLPPQHKASHSDYLHLHAPVPLLNSLLRSSSPEALQGNLMQILMQAPAEQSGHLKWEVINNGH